MEFTLLFSVGQATNGGDRAVGGRLTANINLKNERRRKKIFR